MDIPRHAFREYDIRGVAAKDLTDDLARGIGQGFAGMLSGKGPKLRVAVCRDGRDSSPRLFEALVRGLVDAGCHVIDVGVGPTPLLYFAAHHLGTDGAVMITASHNPAPDNGFKMMRAKSSFFGADIQALADLLERPDFELGRGAGRAEGKVEAQDLAPAYVEHLRASSRLPERRALRFVVDAGNGSAGPLGSRTLRALGFEPDELFCDIDSRFPNHHPDPTVPENLEALVARVKKTKSAFGVAWDGDGDRIGVVDEAGRVIWGDKLLLLFARALLAEHPGAAILGEVKCSQTLYADIEKRGGRPIVWKTGHSLIKTKMKEEKALLAGEMSGHMFFADRFPGYDDAIYATLRLLELALAAGVGEGRGFSTLLEDVPETFATPEIRVHCPDALKFEVVARVRAAYEATHSVLAIDGARIDFGGGAWGLCRASNTGPVLVLRFEALDPGRLAEVRAEVEARVAQAISEASR